MADYVPRKIADFVPWQTNLVTKVVAGATAWGISTDKVTALQAAKAIYMPLYNKIIDPDTKTKGAVQQHREGRKTYSTFLRAFVKENLRNNSAITIEEKIGLGINPGIAGAGPRPAIDVSPDLQVRAKGDLVIQIQVRSESDSTRPSILPAADGVELRFKIGGPAPANYNEAPEVFFSGKARFKKLLEAGAEGVTIYIFARWKNNTDDTKSGPWCAMKSIVVR